MLQIFSFFLNIIFVNFYNLGTGSTEIFHFYFFLSLFLSFIIFSSSSCSGNLKKNFLSKLEFLDTLLSYLFGVLLNCTADDTFSLKFPHLYYNCLIFNSHFCLKILAYRGWVTFSMLINLEDKERGRGAVGRIMTSWICLENLLPVFILAISTKPAWTSIPI